MLPVLTKGNDYRCGCRPTTRMSDSCLILSSILSLSPELFACLPGLAFSPSASVIARLI